MKKRLTLLVTLLLSFSLLTACGNNAEQEKKQTDQQPVATQQQEPAQKDAAAPTEMQYITVEEFQKNPDDYVILDLRKAEDYKVGHIPNAISADQDSLAKGGQKEPALDNLKKAIDGKDGKLVLVCYSGKSYAQAGTDNLKELGYDLSKVYTLEGGMKAWNPYMVEHQPKVEKKTISVDDAAAAIGNPDYTFVDLRKADDVKNGSIEGAVKADITPAIEGDVAQGFTELAPLMDKNNNIVLICYTGNKYAQLGTDILTELGYDKDKILTLDGGFKAFSAEKPDLVKK